MLGIIVTKDKVLVGVLVMVSLHCARVRQIRVYKLTKV